MRQVRLYDTTLRDGLGTPGLSLSVEERLKVAQALDRLGVHFIEAGFPSSNPKEAEFFARLAELELDQATVCAFGMTRRRDTRAEDDEALAVLVGTFADVVCLVGKSWGLHLEKVIKASPEENLAMVADSVAFCHGAGKRVVYDAEHFFDGYRDDPGYALECVRAAAEAGAENVTLCDTNGGSLPGFVGETTAAVVEALGDGVEVGSDEQLASLSRTSHYVDELCNMPPDPSQAYVGWHAFTHKAGMHGAAVEVDPRTFEHVDPALVGNQSESTPSELSGKGTIRAQAKQLGVEMDDAATARAVELLKEREHRGYHYEAAPASFELLLRRAAGEYAPLFRLESYRVITSKKDTGEAETEATIRVHVDGERHVCWAVGNGPVNALDKALRKALTEHYPELAKVELTNYKVCILDESHGTGAVTRVLLDSTGDDREWGTIGVSENIIEASWEALVDSLEYAFQPR